MDRWAQTACKVAAFAGMSFTGVLALPYDEYTLLYLSYCAEGYATEDYYQKLDRERESEREKR